MEPGWASPGGGPGGVRRNGYAYTAVETSRPGGAAVVNRCLRTWSMPARRRQGVTAWRSSGARAVAGAGRRFPEGCVGGSGLGSHPGWENNPGPIAPPFGGSGVATRRGGGRPARPGTGCECSGASPGRAPKNSMPAAASRERASRKVTGVRAAREAGRAEMSWEKNPE